MTIVFFLLGFALTTFLGLLICVRVFHKLPDQGLGLAPTVGLFALSYPLFWLSYIRFIALTTPLVWGCLIFSFLAVGYLAWRTEFDYRSVRIPKALVISQVVCWFSLFALYLIFRRQAPDILGIEKLSDFGMLNSIFQYGKMPTPQILVSEQVMNYYYFGFFQSAMWARLCALQPNEIFHIMMAYILASSGTVISSFAFTLTRDLQTNHNAHNKTPNKAPNRNINPSHSQQIFSAWLCLIFTFFIGTLHTLYINGFLGKKFWYSDATRFIANTIHEFPLYDFIIGDLHAHMLNLPNSLIAPILIYLLAKKIRESDKPQFLNLKETWPLLVSLCLSFGLSYVSNSWDIFTGLMLAGFAIWWAFSRPKPQNEAHPLSFFTLRNTGIYSVILVVGSIVAFFPFWVMFKPMSQGIELVPTEISSPIVQLFIVWILHLIFPALFFIQIKTENESQRFIKLWTLVALGFIGFVEIVYFKDIYSGHLRANTMFKIWFQVWFWLAIISGVTAAYLIPRSKNIFSVLLALIIGAGAYYPYLAIPQYLDSVQGQEENLDGLGFLRKKYPDELKLIEWLNKRKPQPGEWPPTLLSSAESSFSEGGAVNFFTGLPTVVTWFNHAWLWYGSPDTQMRPRSRLAQRLGIEDTLTHRSDDVRLIYQTEDASEALKLISKYQVQYILVSEFERKNYPKLSTEKLSSFAKVVFDSGPVQLYEVTTE